MSIRNLQTSNLKSYQALNVASIGLTPSSDTDLILSDYYTATSDITWEVNTLSVLKAGGIKLVRMGNMVHGWIDALSISGTFVGTNTELKSDYVIPSQFQGYLSSAGSTLVIGCRLVISGTPEMGQLLIEQNAGTVFTFRRGDGTQFPAAVTSVAVPKLYFSYPVGFS